MKRFDDFIKLLLSVLIGQVVREYDIMSASLVRDFNNHAPGSLAGPVSNWMPLAMILFYLRNIHGSVCYDALLTDDGVVPEYERRLFWRFAAFLLSLSALFVFPYWTQHELSHHLCAESITDPTASGCVGLAASPRFVLVLVTGPFVAYGLWNALLWLTLPEQDTPAAVRTFKVVHNWLIGDAGVVLIFLAGLTLNLWYAKNSIAFPAEYYGLGFIAAVAWTVLSDYGLNRSFFFPSREPEPTPTPTP